MEEIVDVKIDLPKDTYETIAGIADFAGLSVEQMIAALLSLYLCKKP